MVFTEFNDKKGEIVSGLIQKADGKIVVMDLGKLEGVMPLKEQIPTETYRVNDKIRGYVLEVERGLKGTKMAQYNVNNIMVSSLLSSIRDGTIAIPEIQRPFVWDPTKVRDLIDSLYKPIQILTNIKIKNNQ